MSNFWNSGFTVPLKILNRFCSASIFLLVTFCVSQNVKADQFFVTDASIPCRMLLELEFQNVASAQSEYIVIDTSQPGTDSASDSGFDYFLRIVGQNKRATIHRANNSDEYVLVIQDRDLPCRTLLSTSPPATGVATSTGAVAVAEITATQTTAIIQPVQPAAPAVQPVQQAAPAVQPVQPVAPAVQPVQQAAPSVQPVQPTAPAVQPVQQAAPAVQPVQQAASSAQPVQQATSSMAGEATAQQVQLVNRTMSPAEAQIMIDEVHARITLFNVIAGVIKDKPRSRQARVLGIVDNEIVRLRAEKQILESLLSQRFSTPIRPSNANLSVSAFRAADTFPKIPYYVPGTNEFGEMLVIPRVSDEGMLNYEFDFIDPVANYAKVRDRIVVPHDQIEVLINGMEKVDEWTTVAQENNITRRVAKTAGCFPEENCGEKKVGSSSTEVVFQIYEDGSTAGRIQRNKGQYVVGYNMSVESSILLGAYLIYMQEAGAKDFNIGVMTDDQVLDLFN